VADVTVRPAAVDDADGFVRAYEASWDAALGELVGRPLQEFSPYEERLESFRRAVADLRPEAGVWVAERGGEIVGVAVRSGAELRSLYVAPQAWGTGIAVPLMAAAIDAIRADGHAEATLWVVDANARARRFYEREGWVLTGDTKETEFGPEELRYQLQLAP
jgi:GNAT superfamily N-acetyltransferase